MKLTFIFLLGALLQVSASGTAQQITFSEKKVSLEKVFRIIRIQTGYHFLYSDKQIKMAGPVTVMADHASLEDVLAQCFTNQPLTYTIVDRTIVVKIKEEGLRESPVKMAAALISGTVKDEKGSPVAGASVYNKKSKKGTSTDKDGAYSILADVGDVLEFSSVGYLTYQYKTSTKAAAVNIILEVQVAGLSEAVVIGYGTAQKKDLTGSVAVVVAKDIQDIPFTTVDNALAGKVAGVEVTKTDGTPGGAVRIRVRGSSSLLGGNDPLYVIDGVPLQVQTNFLSPGFDVGTPAANDINPSNAGIGVGIQAGSVNALNSIGGLNIDDIESITILKDASSTAIYGSKAANGVIIVTTKRGRKDMKPQIMVDYYGTVTSPLTPKVLNASQYKTLITEAAQNDYDYRSSNGLSIPDNVDQILNNPAAFFGTANTNWLKQVTRSSFANNIHVSVQGGSATSKYYTAVSYNNTPGVVVGTTYQRVAGKLNLENEIGNHFKFITNIDLGYIQQNITNGAYGQALRARPDYKPLDSTGNFTNFANVGQTYQGFQNPLAMTTAINNSKTLSLLGSVTAEYDFTPTFQFKSTVALNMQGYNQRNYNPSYLDINNFYGNASSNGGIGSNSNSNLADWFIENTLSYTKKFNEKHSIAVLVGTSYETRKNSYFTATASGYPNDNILNGLSSAVTPIYVRGDNPSKPQSYLLSFYLRANYTFLDKYIFTFTGRSDGSSKFGPDNKFGYFPSGAVAWRISKENFMKNISWIDDIKIRGSYGLVGSQNIGDQMYRTLYSPFSYAGTSALIPTQLGNPAVKWESTKEVDGGLDFAFFKNRLEGTFDYYDKHTNGVLLQLPVAPSSAYTNLLNNYANIKNSGYELSLSGDIIRSKNFRWSASVNITWNKSLVTKTGGADLAQLGGGATGLELGNTALIAGKPLGLIMGYKVNGIIRNQKQLDDYKNQLNFVWSQYILPFLKVGDPIFALDTTGAPAQQVIANAAPKFWGGFTQGFSYKNVDLTFYFTFSGGGKLLWADHVSSLEFSGTSNANVVMLNRYNAENTNSTQPRLILNDAYLPVSSLSVFNSSYIKLRTLTLNYRFSKTAWMEKAAFKSASLFLTATNLFTITKYPGNNPETSDDPYSVQGGYYDVSNYPPVRTFSAGVKFGF